MASSAASAKLVNPEAEVVAKNEALMVNISAARGLQSVLKSNLGPRGTLKMLVGGAGQLKLTKDGAVLLHEMQIQHPTASLIARTATAQDDMTGDGTTSVVIFTGELLKQAQRHTEEGLHPRVIAEGYDKARDHVLTVLENMKVPVTGLGDGGKPDRELLTSVARTSLRTKLQPEFADKMTDIVVDAVMCVRQADNNEGQPVDLHMVEILTMKHKSSADTRFVNGLVIDHGARHPDMPTKLKNCHILTCNVSMEYEKAEVAAGFYYSNAEEREKLLESERKFTDEKCKQVVEFKRSICKEGESFVVINQKGIDPLSLDMLAKEGIFAARRAKRRNMERLQQAVGGSAVNCFDDLDISMLGWANSVEEVTLGEDKFTFIEEPRHPSSCTVLIKGPNQHAVDQTKDALRDGLRAVKNTLDDGAVIPGGAAFEVAAAHALKKFEDTVEGKAKLGVRAYADSLLIIPKTLAENSGFDIQDSLIKIQDEHAKTGGHVGLDVITGEPMLAAAEGVWDNWIVKRQFLHLSTVLATQLLLVDEVMKAGKQMGGGSTNPDDEVDGGE